MTVWQIAAGSEQRDYAEDFLNRGMAFVSGFDQSMTLEQVQCGDLLVLKRGISKVEAIGEVVARDSVFRGRGDKHWLRDFDGWDLDAYVYVDWRKPESDVTAEGLRRGTICRINRESLRNAVVEAFASGTPIAPTHADPAATAAVEDEEILSALIRHGMSPRRAEDLTTTFTRIRRLARYYRNECHWNDVREHETRTFLVVPLLQALGWAEQQIKIELAVPRGRIDLACFRRPYRRNSDWVTNDSDCELIIETKGFSQGLSLAPSQVKRYAEHFPSVRAVVVTNGYCYKIYSQDRAEPTSYLNLLDPRTRYPLDPERTAGCVGALTELLPSLENTGASAA